MEKNDRTKRKTNPEKHYMCLCLRRKKVFEHGIADIHRVRNGIGRIPNECPLWFPGGLLTE